MTFLNPSSVVSSVPDESCRNNAAHISHRVVAFWRGSQRIYTNCLKVKKNVRKEWFKVERLLATRFYDISNKVRNF
jgi:hypothetical protein